MLRIVKIQHHLRDICSRHPVMTYVVVFVDVLFVSITLTIVLPFLPQLVKSYGISELHTGKLSSFLNFAVSFFLP